MDGFSSIARARRRRPFARIGRQEVTALHARRAWAGADKQRDAAAIEGGSRAIRDIDRGQPRDGAIVQLHRDPRRSVYRLRHLEQSQFDRYFRA
jgi:hypothetical protein